VIALVVTLTPLTGCAMFGGPGLFSDRIGQATGRCDEPALTLEMTSGNVTLGRGEETGGRIDQSYLNWCCGPLREENVGRTRCPEGTDYVEVARNFVGPGFLVTCYER
jgi:hypothetical protein